MPLITNHCHLGVTAEAAAGTQPGGPGADITAGSPQSRRGQPGPRGSLVILAQPRALGTARGQGGISSQSGPAEAPASLRQKTPLCCPSNPRASSGLRLTQNWVPQTPGQLLIPPEMQKVCVHTVRGCIFPCRNSHPSMLVIP